MVDYDPTTAAPGQVIPFEDLPSTDTPVTAAWLNHLHNVIADVAGNNARLEDVEVELAHKPTTSILMPAAIMVTSPIAAPSFDKTSNGLWPVYAFDASVNEGVISAQLVPTSDVTSYSVRLHWCNLGGGTGDVRWEATVQSFSPTGTAGTEQVVVAAPTASTVNVPLMVVLGTVTLNPAHVLLHVRVWRLATDGTDTLGNDAGLLAISLVPA